MNARESRAPRVLHLVYSGGIYGIERMLLGLLPQLTAQHCTVALGCFGGRDNEGAAVGHVAEAAGIDSHFLGDASQSAFAGVLSIARLIRSWRPDILHMHGYKATILGGMVGALRGTVRMATYHGEASQAVGLRVQLAAETPVLRTLQAVAAVSPPIAEELARRGVKASRIRVIPNGVTPVRCERASDRHEPTIVVIGRLVREKNVQMVLAAAASLRARWPTLRVLVAGEGPYRSELERTAADLALRDAVTFLGFTTDISGLLSRAHVFAMPSDSEGMPLALLEAMSARVPIVATAVGSIPMVARQGAEALLVPRGDQVALNAALSAVLADPEAAAARAEAAARRFNSEFTADSMARSYRDLYDLLLKSRS